MKDRGGVRVEVGPLVGTWHPDGEDPDVGLVILSLEGYYTQLPGHTTGVSRETWEEVVKASRR